MFRPSISITGLMSAPSSPAQNWRKKVRFIRALVTALPSTLVDRSSNSAACLTRNENPHTLNTAMARRSSNVVLDPCAERGSEKSIAGDGRGGA